MKRNIKVRESLDEIIKLTDFIAGSFDDVIKAVELIPELAGEKEVRNYLVILQNDKEIRPSGGVLIAYALFTINKGKLIFVKTAGDVFLLDNEIRANFQPVPDFLRQYRGVNRFYLKDAAFSPDFKVSAQAMADLWSKIPGHSRVDGIVVLDTHFIASLFDIMNTVNVPNYGAFTKENITDELQKFSVLAGSRAPEDKKLKDAVSSLLYELMNQSFASGTSNRAEVVKIFLQEALGKHILSYFTNDKMQNLLEKYNFSGRVREFEGDYLYLSEANVGGDKSNRYLKESVKKSLEIKGEKTISKLEINWENTGDFDAIFNRGFLNYIRIYVPQGSKLIDASGSLVKVTSGEEFGKTFFEGLLRVSPKSKVNLVLSYELPGKLVFNKSYKLLIQKQPGVDVIKYTVQSEGKAEEFDLLTEREIEIKL